MTVLAICGFALLALFILVGATFSTVLFEQNQLQKFADDIAMAGALQLNDADRLGQFNNLEARCRQLVYSSRQTSYQTGQNGPDVQGLAQDLLDEDRQAAKDLETERMRLQALAMQEAKTAITNEYNRQSTIYRMAMPWLKIELPKLESVEFGIVTDTASNVTALKAFDDLVDFDTKKKIVQPTSNLYYGGINAKLPDDDKDLDFKMSALSAPVKNQISAGRLVSTDVFKPVTDGQFPSSVRIAVSANVKPGGSITASTLKVTSCAATTGASIIR
jgi:hypothetical protein